jgi:hypothetical protein
MLTQMYLLCCRWCVCVLWWWWLWLQHIPAVAWQKDLDADLGSEFFETRQAFLSLCQGNHYQFDSLRRAKHSSMMVLYHLHNPEAPAFSSTCNFCHVEIEPGTGLRCTVCSDFDMCKNCHQSGMRHEHPMVVSSRLEAGCRHNSCSACWLLIFS